MKNKNTEFHKPQLFNDHFQNYRRYAIPKAQLIIADIPYNLGNNAYASNPAWYVDGDNSKGESDKANKEFFDTDKNFRISEFLHFCSTMLRPEPKEAGQAPCMIVFCSFEQQFELIEKAKKYGLMKSINLVFRKNFSAQVLKANMKIVGNCEYAVLLYRDKLPKFNNNGKMIFNCFDWVRDTDTEKVHPTQKPVKLLEHLIQLFTDENEVVIDPCAGSGSTLLAAAQTNRKSYGFEIKKDFYKLATTKVLNRIQKNLF
jgi:site-specific DNA-methyltransferase (adenine-specific)